jgi:hypothetical protein
MQIAAVLSDYDGILRPTGSIRLYFWNLEAVCVEVGKKIEVHRCTKRTIQARKSYDIA